MTKYIYHTGTVKSIDGEHLRVVIGQASACSGCAAKSVCNSAESKEKEVDIFTQNAKAFSVGQAVKVVGRLSDGRVAAIIAYALPLLLMVPTMYVAIRLTDNETLGALCGLLAVAIYYVFVYFCLRDRLQRQFSFGIESNIK